MKKIAVLTATRAEYGLLSPIIHKLISCNLFDVRVVVTGAHLSTDFGLTYKEIEEDSIQIDKKIEILQSTDTTIAIAKSMGLAMISFAEYFEELKPDALLVLGDRYETLAVCCTAMTMNIPIIHLYGGETTEGAVDEVIRHSITKMSYLHFTSNEQHKNRVIQLGEEPDRVFDVGAMGVENVLKMDLMSLRELERSIDFSLDKPYAVVTFHPVTQEYGKAKEQTGELLKALNHFGDMKFIITKANADAEGSIINRLIEEYASQKPNVAVFSSLGVRRYLSALKYAKVVIGNSSSGLVEAPSFHIPTVNIGNRQKGRVQAQSVINCGAVCVEIVNAIRQALSEDFRQNLKDVVNPYGNGETSGKVVETIIKVFAGHEVCAAKRFYDIDY